MSANEESLSSHALSLQRDLRAWWARYLDATQDREGPDGEECAQCLAEATRIRKTKSWPNFILSPLLLVLPDFSPLHVGFSLAFLAELLWVITQHTTPFYTNIHDKRFGTYHTLAESLWFGQLSFIGLVSTGLFLLTWSFGYISPHWWSHTSFSRTSLYSLHIIVAAIRLLTGIILLGLVSFPITLLFFLSEFRWLWLWLLGMLVPAIFHLGLAVGRRASGSGPLFRRLQYVNPGPGFDTFTRLTVRLPSAMKRKTQQLDSRLRLAGKTDTIAIADVWHQPKACIDTEDVSFSKRIGPWWVARLFRLPWGRPHQRLIAGNLKLGSESRDNATHFSRCYCCLGPASKARRSWRPMWYEFQYYSWLWRRDRLLRIARHDGHYSDADPERSAALLEDGSTLNQLCVKCKSVCGRSNLLDMMCGMTLRRFVKYLMYALDPRSLTEELFEHWPTTAGLVDAAQKGCHLCSLINDTLSTEQRKQLLDRNDGSIEGETSSTNINEQGSLHTSSLRKSTQVYLKLLAPHASPYVWRHDRNRPYPSSSVLLVPHFGYATVARRWQKKRYVERAVSLNLDPAMKWWLEHVEPIEIRKAGEFIGGVCATVTAQLTKTRVRCPWPYFANHTSFYRFEQQH